MKRSLLSLSIILLLPLFQIGTVESGKVEKGYVILWDDDIPEFEGSFIWLDDVDDIDLGGEQDRQVEFVVTDFEDAGILNMIGYDRFDERHREEITIDGNGVYVSDFKHHHLNDDPPTERIQIRKYTRLGAYVGECVFHLKVQHKKGGGKAIGRTRQIQDLLNQLSVLFNENIVNPIWSLWIGLKITWEGILATLLVLVVGYVGVAIYRRLHKPKRRKLRIKKVDFL